MIRLSNIPNSDSHNNNDFLYDLMSNQKPWTSSNLLFKQFYQRNFYYTFSRGNYSQFRNFGSSWPRGQVLVDRHHTRGVFPFLQETPPVGHSASLTLLTIWSGTDEAGVVPSLKNSYRYSTSILTSPYGKRPLCSPQTAEQLF